MKEICLAILTFESPTAILSNVKPTHLKIIVADQAITHNSKRIVVRTGGYTHFYLAGLKRDGCLCNSARLDHINGEKNPVNRHDTLWSNDLLSELSRRETKSHLEFAAARLELCSPLPLVDSLDVDPYIGHHGPFFADPSYHA